MVYLGALTKEQRQVQLEVRCCCSCCLAGVDGCRLAGLQEEQKVIEAKIKMQQEWERGAEERKSQAALQAESSSEQEEVASEESESAAARRIKEDELFPEFKRRLSQVMASSPRASDQIHPDFPIPTPTPPRPSPSMQGKR